MSGLDAEGSEYGPFQRPDDGVIAALATRQHGVVATWQLHRLGFSSSAIKRRVASGRLHRVHWGVYAVGYRRLSAKGRWLAAVLACGPNAVLSHGAAVGLWQLRPRRGDRVDVTAPGRSRHPRPGMRVHSVRSLADTDRTVRDGIPVTSLARTLLDYAETARAQELRHALDAAERLELFDLRAISELLARCNGRRGTRSLKAALSALGGPPPETRSELERCFLALVRDARMPEPHANSLVCGMLIDFYWPEQRLAVEVDSWAYHRSRNAFEHDRTRDAVLQLAGWRVLRFTDRRMKDEREAVISQLRALLDAASGP